VTDAVTVAVATIAVIAVAAACNAVVAV
ncbi:hypothetical protein A2U01_0088956, partial [Trifolium medium]|nr:hypothetical protein [Trifolium medium]